MLHDEHVSQWYVQYKPLSFDNLLLLKGNKNPHNIWENNVAERFFKVFSLSSLN